MSARSQKVSAFLLIFLIPMAGWMVWKNYREISSGGEKEHEEEPFVVAGKPATEESWMVDQTARDIAEILAYARSATGPLEWSSQKKGSPGSYAFNAKVDGIAVDGAFEAKDYIWSPNDFLPWAQQLVTGWKLTPAAATMAPADFLTKLAAATPAALQAESKRLSAALSQTPLDAALHEQAALVIAGFAMHEAAGEFSDLRRELSRMAAHLTIARALQPTGAGPIRLLGESALQTLAGCEAAAMQALATIPTEAPGSLSWVRALRLRNTGDWRAETDPAVLLESLEAFHARACSIDGHAALLWLQKQKPAPVHDWRRIMIQGDFGVSDGHGFAKDSISHEIESLQADWTEAHGSKLADNEVMKALNEPAGGPVSRDTSGKATLSVLGWDFWSAQHQRHLCQSIRATNKFYRDLWGVPEYREVQKFVKVNFPTLTLFPLLERELTEDAKEATAIAKRVSNLISAHPEMVSPALWTSLRERGHNDDACPPLDIPRPDAWFQPLIPLGTTYGFDLRSSGFALPGGTDPWWKQLAALAPSNYLIRFGQVWKTYGDRPPVAFAEEAYRPIVSYHHRALLKVARAQKGQSDKYPETMEKVCEIDPDYYFELGDWHVEQQQPEKAADAYQKGVDLGEDRIRASNKCGWLVSYLEEHGQPDRALAVATMAAEVYSHTGLDILARLLEKRGQLKEAEDYFEKIEERYEEATELLGFYTRQRAKDPEYEKRASAAERKVFPNGLKKVTLADFQGPPQGGAKLAAASQHTNRAGLRAGEVFVALDGYLVENVAQYMYLRALEFADDLKLIVWNGQAYREVSAKPPNRRFGVDLVELKRP